MLAAIAVGELFAAGEVALIMAVGEILEDITVDKARSGLGRLLALTPATGRKLTATGEQKVHLQDVVGGDILRILPGETVPADGIIVKGILLLTKLPLPENPFLLTKPSATKLWQELLTALELSILK